MNQKLSMMAFLDFLIVIVIVMVAAMTWITNCHIDSRFDKLEKALVEMQK